MEALFYNFKKRSNSTKRPGGDGYYQDILIKEDANITSPTIEIEGEGFYNYNYVYIPYFKRYYFVRECKSIAYGTYEITLDVDLLGTYGTELVGQNVFMYMSASFYDSGLDDNRVVPDSDISYESAYGDFEIISQITPTTFPVYQFLSVANTNGLLNGIDIFFGLDLINTYLRKLTDRNWAQKFSTDVQGINPFDAVNGAWWSPLIPQKCHTVSSNDAQIYDINVSGNCLASPDVLKHHGTVDVPKPSNRDFRYSSKYVKYYLELPYIGVIDVPTELAYNATKLQYDYAGDCLSGEISIVPRIGSVCLGIYSTSLKSDIQMARQSSRGAMAATSTALGGGAGALGGFQLGGVYGAAIGAVAGAAVGSIQGMTAMPKIERVSASSGSIALAGCRDQIGQVRLVMAEAASNLSPSVFTAVAGRPTQKVVAITNGCGYVQTINASASISGYKSEQDRLNAMLDGGVYFE